MLTQFTISLEWLRSKEFILLLKSDAEQLSKDTVVVKNENLILPNEQQ